MSETVGKIASQLMQKEPESRDPIELQREMTSEYIANLIECINRYKKTFVHDFYVVVITKNEKLLPNVFRNQFFDGTFFTHTDELINSFAIFEENHCGD